LILLTTLLVGLRFLLFVRQAATSDPFWFSRPAGVEGFLPIGALLSWKRFWLTGEWDPIHPAAMVILGFAVVVSLLFHKAFCSWFCPIGSVSEWLGKVGERLCGRTILPPRWLDRTLRSLKYLLLGFFVWIIGRMSAAEIAAFIHSPYYRISDVKMLYFFTRLTLTTAIVLVLLGIGSLLIKNFWCRYFCPYGALLGLFSLLSPTRVRRDPERCIDCGRCTEACSQRIAVMQHQVILNAECSGCLDCLKACPRKNALRFETAVFGWTWSRGRVAVGVLMLFAAGYLLAQATGHWDSQIPPAEFRQLLQLIDTGTLTHPRI